MKGLRAITGSGKVITLLLKVMNMIRPLTRDQKFLHYIPHRAVLTGVEFDHADSQDLDHVKSSFRKFADIIPEKSFLFHVHVS